MKTLLLSVVLFAAPLTAASAQADLRFSGGSGTPLTMTLFAPVSYTITAPATQGFFVFKDVGNAFPDFATAINSTFSITVNGGAPSGLDQVNSNFVRGPVAANDVYLFGPNRNLAVGDIVTLTGAFTTQLNYSGARPANGLFQTFVTKSENRSTLLVSGDGVPATTVPEPSSYALMAAGLLGVAGAARRRRASAG